MKSKRVSAIQFAGKVVFQAIVGISDSCITNTVAIQKRLVWSGRRWSCCPVRAMDHEVNSRRCHRRGIVGSRASAGVAYIRVMKFALARRSPFSRCNTWRRRLTKAISEAHDAIVPKATDDGKRSREDHLWFAARSYKQKKPLFMGNERPSARMYLKQWRPGRVFTSQIRSRRILTKKLFRVAVDIVLSHTKIRREFYRKIIHRRGNAGGVREESRRN